METKEFTVLLMTLYPQMRGLALHILRNPEEAADAIQDAAASLWEHRESFLKASDHKAYALTSLRNICLNKIKAARPTTDIDEAQKLTDMTDTGSRIEGADLITQLISSLPEKQQKVMALSVFQSLTGKEIAQLTGLSEENVRQQLSRARRSLRQSYQNELNG